MHGEGGDRVIHPTAIVDPGAELAEGVRVGPYSIIGPDVVIGRDTEIGPHVVINGPTRIGEENRIFQFASIGEQPQDLKYHGEPTRLEIGDRNVIREYATMNRGTVSGGELTAVGDDNLLMAYTHVAHDCIVGNRVIMSNAASLAGHVTIRDHVILGGFTTVHQFTEIGEYSFSGMSTAINRNVPPFLGVTGNYARSFGVNKTGLRRHGFSEEVIKAIHQAFMALIRSGAASREALQRIEPLARQYPEVASFVDFITRSERPIIKG